MKMRTILVDDELWSLKQLELECKKCGMEQVRGFGDAVEAFSYAQTHTVDFALLDVKMPDMDGIVLARELRRINPGMIVIFISAYEEYLNAAMLDVKADYYLLKPYDTKDVQEAFARARYLSGRLRKRVEIRTFGEFDVFVDGQLVEFSNQKAKELLAVCIDSGGGEVAMKKTIEMLWEDRNYDEKVKCLYRKAVVYLNTLFREYGLDSIFGNSRGKCHVNRPEVACDYYEVLDGKNIKDTLFDGRYMTNYSWGEETCGMLCRMAMDALLE